MINMCTKILKKAVYCTPAEFPEILVDQFRMRNEDITLEDMREIPYYVVNQECLIALNKVIRKAQIIE